jgi:hypothetical protein
VRRTLATATRFAYVAATAAAAKFKYGCACTFGKCAVAAAQYAAGYAKANGGQLRYVPGKRVALYSNKEYHLKINRKCYINSLQ